MVIPDNLSIEHEHPYTTTSHYIPHPSSFPPRSLNTEWELEDLEASTFHGEYHRMPEIIDFTNELARQYPKHIELVRLGQTTEAQEILAIRVGKDASRKAKPRVVILGAQHGRDVSRFHLGKSCLSSFHVTSPLSGLRLPPHCTLHMPSSSVPTRNTPSPSSLMNLCVPFSSPQTSTSC